MYKCISATVTVHICTIIVALAFNILHFFLSLLPHSLIFSFSLSPLAMLEDSLKKLRSPKTSPRPTLSKTQIDCALDFLTDWVFESCGSVSFSSLEHPKFQAFLNQVGLPGISQREFIGGRLDTKFEEAKVESEARIRDTMFFQMATDGWKFKNYGVLGEDSLVNLTVILPNGTSLYRREVISGFWGFDPF